MWETAPSEVTLVWFRDLRIRFWGLEIKHLKSTQLRVTRVFFLSLLSRNFDDQLSSNYHRLLFYAYMSRLVFDNYQITNRVWVSLTRINYYKSGYRLIWLYTDNLHKPSVSLFSFLSPSQNYLFMMSLNSSLQC